MLDCNIYETLTNEIYLISLSREISALSILTWNHSLKWLQPLNFSILIQSKRMVKGIIQFENFPIERR